MCVKKSGARRKGCGSSPESAKVIYSVELRFYVLKAENIDYMVL